VWCRSTNLCFELSEVPSAAPSLARPSKREVPFCHTKLGFFPSGMAQPQHPPNRGPPTSKHEPSSASSAHTLRLDSIRAPKDLRDAVLPSNQPSLEQRPNLAVRIGSVLQPQGETQCDRTLVERAINIVTSLPFSLVGLHMLRWAGDGRQGMVLAGPQNSCPYTYSLHCFC
jgi:hypothetical protein